MIDKQPSEFEGFSPKTLRFLKDLQANNNRTWFEAHKQDYQRYLLNPLQSLVAEIGQFMLIIDPYFEITPAVNRTISRIQRDTRFSQDKSPYKTTAWITFKRSRKDWLNAPAYFLEISPDSYRYGMGFYSASRETMDRFRETIDKKPEDFLKAISFYPNQQIFVVEGEKYKRTLDNSKPPEIQDWYQRKNLYLVCNRQIDNCLFGRELISDLIFAFDLIAPFYRYLWSAIE